MNLITNPIMNLISFLFYLSLSEKSIYFIQISLISSSFSLLIIITISLNSNVRNYLITKYILLFIIGVSFKMKLIIILSLILIHILIISKIFIVFLYLLIRILFLGISYIILNLLMKIVFL
jgi:hypothetical protein